LSDDQKPCHEMTMLDMEELDARLAERLFGASIYRSQWSRGIRRLGTSLLDPVPPFTRSLLEAMRVLDAMAERGYAVALVTCASGWACDITRSGGLTAATATREFGWRWAPLAICRAADAALASEVP
jgi:hypothetical protein